MNAVILNIGDEILIGDTVNTNASWISSVLDGIGIRVVYIKVIGDLREEIIQSLNEIKKDIDVVLITGGLGPTHDDITKHTMAEYFGDKLVKNDTVFADVEAILAKFGKSVNGLNISQSLVPSRCEVVRNPNGTAPGMIFRERNKFYVSMPGVPYEMKFMLKNSILPILEKMSDGDYRLHRHLKTFGTAEATLAEILEEEINLMDEKVKLAFLPSPGKVKLRLTASGRDKEKLTRDLEIELDKIMHRLGEKVYGFSDDTLESVIGSLLKERQQSVSTAESCTGGKLASKITSIPGSSEYFQGCIVAYSNDIKIKELNVSPELIEKYGAVSEEVVMAMAEGVRKKLGTDFGISTSGIAGPDGGSEDKPVGTVWIGVSYKDRTIAKLIKLRFNRKTNIDLSADHALDLLRKELIRKV